VAERPGVDHYGAQYGHFATELYAEIRLETFGEDIGQNGWLTTQEQNLFLSWLHLNSDHTLLDVACGSGGPSLRIARLTGCKVQGIDLHQDAVAQARAQAVSAGLADRVSFDLVDAGQTLPFGGAGFDAIVCVDALNHLPDRSRVLRDWARVLRPEGRVVYTDPIVVTGPLTNEEIAIRTSIGFFLIVPAGANEEFLTQAGLELVEMADRTENMARIAGRWLAARAAREADLRRIEGHQTFEGQQRFFEVAERLAATRRLSRFAFCARRTEAG
jgi:2-polyprenyl-3-methyl-5-hydroxy-6-metoxy-1,4-benzoquinol methylase